MVKELFSNSQQFLRYLANTVFCSAPWIPKAFHLDWGSITLDPRIITCNASRIRSNTSRIQMKRFPDLEEMLQGSRGNCKKHNLQDISGTTRSWEMIISLSILQFMGLDHIKNSSKGQSPFKLSAPQKGKPFASYKILVTIIVYQVQSFKGMFLLKCNCNISLL